MADGMAALRAVYGLRDSAENSNVDWGTYVPDVTARSLDILGARYGEGRYISPDDPRYGYETISRPVANYDPYAGGGAYNAGSRVALNSGGQVLSQSGVGISPGGVGVNVSYPMLFLGGLLFVSFIAGQRRGK